MWGTIILFAALFIVLGMLAWWAYTLLKGQPGEEETCEDFYVFVGEEAFDDFESDR